jgi:hypothetical protein
MPKKEPLKELPPEPVDERAPLLGSGSSTEEDELEAQAEQERRVSRASRV